MTSQLDSGTKLMLQAYVNGRISNRELSEWLVAAEYDEELSERERDSLAQLRLIVLEAEEGSRPADEILQAVSAMLASAQGKVVYAIRTSSETQTMPGRVVTAGSPVQHAGITP
jgi:hypothetical protein